MALIDARRGGHSAFFFLAAEDGTRDEAKESVLSICAKETECAPARAARFPIFIEEKYDFIHAISVHSSAGASLDSLCHLHSNILINGSDVSTACSPMWQGGWGCGHVVSEGIYNKVALSVRLKTFPQVYVSRQRRRHASTSAADREVRRFIYDLEDGRRLKRETEKERERERKGEREKHILSGDPLFMN